MELTVQEQTHSTGAAESPPDITKRLRAIRAGLPGQMLKERLQTARICYGMLYTEAEIRKKVADTLPPRVGLVRRVGTRGRPRAHRELQPPHS
jgi:hypothetical protein